MSLSEFINAVTEGKSQEYRRKVSRLWINAPFPLNYLPMHDPNLAALMTVLMVREA